VALLATDTLRVGLARPLDSAVPAIGHLRYNDLVVLAAATLLLPSVLARLSFF
jgi:hypothetical protein